MRNKRDGQTGRQTNKKTDYENPETEGVDLYKDRGRRSNGTAKYIPTYACKLYTYTVHRYRTTTTMPS